MIATADPIDIFRAEADLKPYRAKLPDISLDNLISPPARDASAGYWIRRTSEQDMSHADMADPAVLNQVIWYSVRCLDSMPPVRRLPAFEAIRLGMTEEREELAEAGSERED